MKKKEDEIHIESELDVLEREINRDFLLLLKILKMLEDKVIFNHNLTLRDMALDCFKQFVDNLNFKLIRLKKLKSSQIKSIINNG